MRIRHMGVFLHEDLRRTDAVLGSQLSDHAPIFSTGEDFQLTPTDILSYRQRLDALSERARHTGTKLNIEPAFYEQDDFSKGRPVNNCLHLWTQVFVDPWGRMNPCAWFDKIHLGDLREESFDEIWNSEQYGVIRQNVSNLAACKKCCYFNLTLTDNAKAAVFKHQNMLKGLLAR